LTNHNCTHKSLPFPFTGQTKKNEKKKSSFFDFLLDMQFPQFTFLPFLVSLPFPLPVFANHKHHPTTTISIKVLPNAGCPSPLSVITTISSPFSLICFHWWVDVCLGFCLNPWILMKWFWFNLLNLLTNLLPSFLS